MKKKNLIHCIAILLLMVLSGCENSPFFPVASGRPYEVLVIMNTKEWEAPVGRALFDVLDTDVPMLPQSERSFRISQADELNRTLQIFRNIIEVDIDDRKYTKCRMKYETNRWAKEQVILKIHAPSKSEFEVYVQENRQRIIDFLTKMEMNRLIVELKKDHSEIIAHWTKEIFGCEFLAPKEITSYKKGTNFLWGSNNSASGLTNIVIYSYPYEGPETFNKCYALAKRDSIMEKNLPGEKPGMFMTADSNCVAAKPVVVHGQYAFEMRGLWIMKNDCMGGPFVSFSRVDQENNRVIVAEGFVYAPEKMKRGLIRRLEGCLYTLKLPEEQYAVAITPDVEEEKTPADNKE